MADVADGGRAVPAEVFDSEKEWPEPSPEPAVEPVDGHQGPLDDDEDGRFLEVGDPRRTEAERRRGRPFEEG
jgi:hypothetical protein